VIGVIQKAATALAATAALQLSLLAYTPHHPTPTDQTQPNHPRPHLDLNWRIIVPLVSSVLMVRARGSSSCARLRCMSPRRARKFHWRTCREGEGAPLVLGCWGGVEWGAALCFARAGIPNLPLPRAGPLDPPTHTHTWWTLFRFPLRSTTLECFTPLFHAGCCSTSAVGIMDQEAGRGGVGEGALPKAR